MTDYLLAFFAGFAVGRIGHILGGQIMWIPHHWIFGLTIILAGIACIFFKKLKYLAIILVFIGAGIFVSDFRDFLLLRVWEPDDTTVLKFWAVN